MSWQWHVDSNDVEEVRDLARAGLLAAGYADADKERRTELYRCVYQVAGPIVFARITLKMERNRGHRDCVRGLPYLRPECLDRFHDDVEAMVDYAFVRAKKPIEKLESWLATRVSVATVDRHRIRRGEREAQQRPAVPKWLRAALTDDPWLVELALRILTWVGVPDTAGSGLWPVDAWADRRGAVTGAAATSDSATLLREIKFVLDVMRVQRPRWYERYVQRPLEHKPAPLAPAVRDADGDFVERPRLQLVGAWQHRDSALHELAARCVDAIVAGLAEPGADPEQVVLACVRAAFCAELPDPAEPPHGAGAESDVAELLSDPAGAARVAVAVLEILRES